MTEGRRAFSRPAASADTAVGGSAIIDAVAAQNFRKPRRLTPCLLSRSPNVIFDGIYAFS
jgi:hypothetical protein